MDIHEIALVACCVMLPIKLYVVELMESLMVESWSEFSSERYDEKSGVAGMDELLTGIVDGTQAGCIWYSAARRLLQSH